VLALITTVCSYIKREAKGRAPCDEDKEPAADAVAATPVRSAAVATAASRPHRRAPPPLDQL